LRYFNIYRLLLAAVCLALWRVSATPKFGSHNLAHFKYVSGAYLLLAFGFQVLLEKFHSYFNAQLSMHVMRHRRHGVADECQRRLQERLGVMLLISLAAAARVIRGALTMFYAGSHP